MKTLKSFFALLRPYAGKTATAFACILATNALALALPWGLKLIIDEAGSGAPRLRLVDMVCAGLACALFFKFLLGFACEYLINLVGENVVGDLRGRLYRHLQRLSVAYLDRTPRGHVLSGLLGDIDGIKSFLFGGLVDFAYSFFSIFFILATLFLLDRRMALIAVVYLPVFGIAFYRVSPRLTEHFRRVRERAAELTSHLNEVLNGMRIVSGFAMEETEAERFHAKQGALVAASLAGHRLGIGMWLSADFLSSLGLVTLLWFGGRAAFAGRMTVGTLTAFYAYVAMLLGPIVKVAVINNSLQEAVACLERVRGVLGREPEIRQRPNAVKHRIDGRVVFDKVRFGYGGGREVLRDVSLDVRPREVVALVGPSGAGKTTLINLLLRFYDPREGRVLIDGIDLRDLDLRAYRSQIAMVLQDDYLFDASVRENILYGRPQAGGEQVVRAARRARCHDFIEELPQGYATRIGEKGGMLSCGQRQRLSIARALLRDPALLILDEATSAVDSATERAIVEEAYRDLMRGRTTFIIAHRLSTIAGADRILVMDNGRFTESGTHSALLERRGLYAKLWGQQISSPAASADPVREAVAPGPTSP
ncbi:MAG: ABC transporter ATP-binding protein [Deltaproteobacteria bacterium]